MSLINKMLQDLDERRASALERDGISRHVRTLPPPRTLPWRSFVLGLAGALAGAAAVWFALRGQIESAPAPIPAPALVSAPAPSVPVASVQALPPPPMPDKAAPKPAEASPEPARKAVQRLIAASPAREPALKLDHTLDADHDVSSFATASPPVAVKPQAEEVEPSPPRIEKRPRTPAVSETAEAAYRKGMDLIKRGSLADAATALRSALQIAPGHLTARQALLSLLVDRQQWEEAQAVAAEGLALDPQQTGWAMLVARLQVERGKIPSALATLEQYAQYAQDNAEYLSFQALLLHKAKRYSEAVEHYRAALALMPGEGRWWYGLGLALDAGQHPAEAKEAYTRARASANLPADMTAAVEQKLKP